MTNFHHKTTIKTSRFMCSRQFAFWILGDPILLGLATSRTCVLLAEIATKNGAPAAYRVECYTSSGRNTSAFPCVWIAGHPTGKTAREGGNEAKLGGTGVVELQEGVDLVAMALARSYHCIPLFSPRTHANKIAGIDLRRPITEKEGFGGVRGFTFTFPLWMLPIHPCCAGYRVLVFDMAAPVGRG